jgi:branched-chain amino acid transport system ATP-binding protein
MAPLLSVRNLSKQFGAVVVARDIDLDLAPGEALGMLGPNGAGKTTFFGLITGTIVPQAGSIVFDGHDITRLTAAARCRLGMARSFQVPQPFAHLTVFENCVAAGAFARNRRESAVYDRAAFVLRQCGLAAKANVKAGKLTLLDRKRLELARALTTEPRLLLLDEVAGGLSEPECAILIDLIRTIRATGVSLIWIEHVIHALTAVVDRVVVLSGGTFIADDTPDAAIRDPRVVEVYMGIPAAEAEPPSTSSGGHNASA